MLRRLAKCPQTKTMTTCLKSRSSVRLATGRRAPVIKVHCTFTDVSGSSTQGEVDLASLSSRERFLRSVKRASIFFGIAVVSVLIPMLHFVLVPGFLVLGALVFSRTLNEKELVRQASGTCPACHHVVTLEGPISTKKSKEICPHCRQLLKLKIAHLSLIPTKTVQ